MTGHCKISLFNKGDICKVERIDVDLDFGAKIESLSDIYQYRTYWYDTAFPKAKANISCDWAVKHKLINIFHFKAASCQKNPKLTIKPSRLALEIP